MKTIVQLLTVPQAAKRADLTPAALYTAINQKRLIATEQYGRRLVAVAELERYLRETKIGRPSNGTKRKPAKKR